MGRVEERSKSYAGAAANVIAQCFGVLHALCALLRNVCGGALQDPEKAPRTPRRWTPSWRSGGARRAAAAATSPVRSPDPRDAARRGPGKALSRVSDAVICTIQSVNQPYIRVITLRTV